LSILLIPTEVVTPILNPDKDRPSPEWIAALRHRFVTERQVDSLLTRKLERRSGPRFTPLTLPQLQTCLESLIRARTNGPFTLHNVRWLSGGASKLQVAFDLEWDRPGVGAERTPMVLRMEPAESLVETNRLREFQLVKAFEGLLPIPTAFWCDEFGEHLPYPALVYGFVTGVTKPKNTTSGVSGSGTYFNASLRERLAPQFIDYLATIHNFDFRKADLSAFDVPEPGTQCAEWGVNWWERVWEEDGDEEIPLLRVAAAWLRRNAPTLQHPSIVHADYRSGNFLFSEEEGRITALLDWELGRIGDRHQDLAWTTNRAFTTMDDDGQTQLVCGLASESAFLDAYQRATGVDVNPRTLHWYKVYNGFSLAILLIGTGYRIARNGKTHHDVLVTWLIGIGYLILDEMRDYLEKGC